MTFQNLGLNSASTELASYTLSSGFVIATLPENQVTTRGVDLPIPAIPVKSNADVIVDAIHAAVDNAGGTVESSPKPTTTAISALTKLLAVLPDSVLGEPDVDVFRGEIHLQWSKDAREIVLMGFSKDKEPLVHHYERIKGKPSEHGIEKATAAGLKKWLRWLNG